MKQKLLKSFQSFSFLELMIFVAIIAMLAAN
jgi:Tfp pilus assembly protein FimT